MRILGHTFLFTVVLWVIEPCSAQFQLRETTPTNVPEFEHYGVATSDDGMITLTKPSLFEPIEFRKVNADGEEVWSRILNAEATVRPFGMDKSMISDGAGGCYVSLVTGNDFIPDPTNEVTTALQHGALMRINSDGSTGPLLDLTRTTATPWGQMMFLLGRVYLFQGPANTIGAIFLTWEGLNTSVAIGLFDQDLEPLWLRSFGRLVPLGPSTATVYGADIEAEMSPSATPDGGILHHWYSINSGDLVDLIKITATGSIEWANSYTYTNSAVAQDYPDIVVDPSGNIHVAGNITLSNNAVGTFVPVINSDGTVRRGDMYRGYHSSTDIKFTPDGRRILQSGGMQSLLYCDTLGSAATVYEVEGLQIGNDDVFYGWDRLELMGTYLTGTGGYVERDINTSYTNYYPSVHRFDINTLGLCYGTDTTTEHVDIPVEIFEAEALADLVSVDVASEYALTLIEPFGLLPTDALERMPICNTAGVDERLSKRPVFLLSNVVLPGESIQFTHPGIARVEVHDMQGSLKNAQLLGTRSSLATDDLGPGLHLVRAWDARGTVIGTERVLVLE